MLDRTPPAKRQRFLQLHPPAIQSSIGRPSPRQGPRGATAGLFLVRRAWRCSTSVDSYWLRWGDRCRTIPMPSKRSTQSGHGKQRDDADRPKYGRRLREVQRIDQQVALTQRKPLPRIRCQTDLPVSRSPRHQPKQCPKRTTSPIRPAPQCGPCCRISGRRGSVRPHAHRGPASGRGKFRILRQMVPQSRPKCEGADERRQSSINRLFVPSCPVYSVAPSYHAAAKTVASELAVISP